MTTSSIKRCLGLELSFGVRLALAWIAAGLVSVAGLAGCGGAPSDSGSNSSSNVLGGTAANTLQKRFDYPNVIDATFGNNGTVSMSTGYSEKVTVNGFETHDFIVDRLGRIVVVGTRSSAAREAWIYRMLADGSPDATCGTAGWSSFTTTGGPATPRKIVQLPDGRYVMGGVLGPVGIAAIAENCSLDRSFGTSGFATFPSVPVLEVGGLVNALAVDSSGRILATVENTQSGRLVLARFLSNGQLDASFGTAGIASVKPVDGTNEAIGRDIAVRPDGRVLIATQMVYSAQVGFWAGFAQLLPNGALDVSFGEAGFVSVKPIPNFIANPASMVLLPDGSAIQGGLTQPGVLVGTGMLVDAYWLKVDASGRPDARFGNSGLLIWNAGPQGFDGQNNVGAMAAIGANGDQFASCQYWMNRTAPTGQATLASQQSIVQWRSSATGALQTEYANGGTGWLPRDNDPKSELWNRCIGLKVGKDSKLLALLELGSVERALTPMFAVARISGK
jgi:uncharacterized delta-60 repeat protein